MKSMNTAPVLPAEPLKMGLGLALDLGTEKVGAYLYDLAAGTLLAETGADNAQKIFGNGIFDRIDYAARNRRVLQFTSLIREQVYDLLLELCKKAEKKTGRKYSFPEIHYISIAGNPTMQHFYAAISPESIAKPGNKPVTLFGEQILAEPVMYYCPCLSGLCGGNLTAGLLAAEAETEEGAAENRKEPEAKGMQTEADGNKREKYFLYADVGTRVSLALGNKTGWFCGDADPEEAAETVKKLLSAEKAAVGDIAKVLLAGSYGATAEEVRKKAADFLPEELKEKEIFLGNAAGYGACLALTQKEREQLGQLAARCSLLPEK